VGNGAAGVGGGEQTGFPNGILTGDGEGMVDCGSGGEAQADAIDQVVGLEDGKSFRGRETEQATGEHLIGTEVGDDQDVALTVQRGEASQEGVDAFQEVGVAFAAAGDAPGEGVFEPPVPGRGGPVVAVDEGLAFEEAESHLVEVGGRFDLQIEVAGEGGGGEDGAAEGAGVDVADGLVFQQVKEGATVTVASGGEGDVFLTLDADFDVPGGLAVAGNVDGGEHDVL